MKEKTLLTICLFITVTSVIVGSFFILRAGHRLNGDYALYICQAKSLLSGSQWGVFEDMKEMIHMSTYPYYSPIVYPWGFPLLLALPVAVFGIDYLLLKILLFVCILLTLYVLAYDYQKRKEVITGCWVLLLLGLNYNILVPTDRIISDLFFLLLLTLSLSLIQRFHFLSDERQYFSTWQGILLGAILFLTIQTRTEGILLLPALLAHQAAEIFPNRKTIRYGLSFFCSAGMPYAVLILLFVATLPLFPLGFLEHSSHVKGLSTSLLLDNWIYYLYEGPAFCFQQEKGTLLMAVIFWFFVLGGILFTRRRQLATLVYFIFNLLLLAVWPYQTLRYFIPIAPIVLYFFVIGVRQILTSRAFGDLKFSSLFLSLCVCLQVVFFIVNITGISKEYGKIDVDVDSHNTKEVFEYIRKNTLPTDWVACCESRTIYLYTGRKSCNLFGPIEETVKKADWYVVFRNRGTYLQYDPYLIEDDTEHFKAVYSNSDFIIYKIKKS